MLSKISCSATKLSLLQPAMIRAIVEGSAFRVGKQYASEKRVRISRADEVEIVSLVMGNAGPLEQTIQLKEGSLLSQCTCQLNERPLCRHCIAVLLEYHRAGGTTGAKAAPAPAWESAGPAASTWESASPPHACDSAPAETVPRPAASQEIKFSDIAVFVDWLQPAFAAIERGESLPEAPMLGRGPVDEWVRTIHSLEQGQRLSEDAQQALRAEVDDARNRLEAAVRQASEAHAAHEEMKSELARRRAIDKRLADVTLGIDRFGQQIQAIAEDLASSGARLEALNGSFQEISQALDSIAKASVH